MEGLVTDDLDDETGRLVVLSTVALLEDAMLESPVRSLENGRDKLTRYSIKIIRIVFKVPRHDASDVLAGHYFIKCRIQDT